MLVKVGIVLFVIVAGLWFIDAANWTGISPELRHKPDDPADGWGLLGQFGVHELLGGADERTRSPFLPFGLSGVLVGAAVVFFSYLGFDAVSTTAEEAQNPRRDVPIGILASLVICTLLYIGVSAVLTGMEPYHEIKKEAAVASAFARRADAGSDFPRVAAGVISIGALAGMTSVMLATFLGQARIFLAMARDGLLPAKVFGAVHPRYRTPHVSTMLTGGLDGRRRRAGPAGGAGEPDLHRHADGLRGGLRGGDGPARVPARSWSGRSAARRSGWSPRWGSSSMG